MSALFLTNAEMAELTGLSQSSAQERWLLARGLRASRNRAGRVMLTRDALVQWQSGRVPAQNLIQQPVTPKWDSVK
ncbi:DUF4224 domain-containing protein [Thiomonas sp.]